MTAAPFALKGTRWREVADGFVAVQQAGSPTHYIDNEQVAEHLGLPVERQRVASFEQTGLVPVEYDEINMTYNLDGTLATVTYLKGGSPVAALTLSYSGGNLTSVVRS